MQIFTLFIIVLIAIISNISWAIPAPPFTSVFDAGVEARKIASTTDQILFQYSLEQFVDARDAKQPSNLIWDLEGCTSGDNKAANSYFRFACQRHDFGLRNYHQQSRLTQYHRKTLDENFMHDMEDLCAFNPFWIAESGEYQCTDWAKDYYHTARETSQHSIESPHSARQ